MIECWKCPQNTVDKCKHGEKYCKRYTVEHSYLPDTNKEAEKIREKERLFWESQSKVNS